MTDPRLEFAEVRQPVDQPETWTIAAIGILEPIDLQGDPAAALQSRSWTGLEQTGLVAPPFYRR